MGKLLDFTRHIKRQGFHQLKFIKGQGNLSFRCVKGLTDASYSGKKDKKTSWASVLFILNSYYSRAEVQRFMIPKLLKQRFMILTCFVTMIHDSASTPDHIPASAETMSEYWFHKTATKKTISVLQISTTYPAVKWVSLL